MGLFLRLNLFYQVTAEDVYRSYARLYRARGQSLIDEGDDFYCFTLYEQSNSWTVLSLDGGWEWEVRREVQRQVSQELGCPGFLIFVYDGDYWGYEFFSNGATLDHFVQDREDGSDYFPGESCLGDADILARHLPSLDRRILQRYLVHDPEWHEYEDAGNVHLAHAQLVEARNIRAQPTDEFLPFDECFVLDFLRYLGIAVELQEHYVTFLAPVWRTFWISDQNTHEAWDRMYRK